MEIRSKRRLILGITGAMLAVVAFSGSAFAAGAGLRQRQLRDRGIQPASATSTSSGLNRVHGLSPAGPSPAASTGPGRAIWHASQGTKSIDLEGAEGATGAISQTFATNPGSTYVVTFDMSGNPYSTRAIKTMTVAATGADDELVHRRHRRAATDPPAGIELGAPDLHVRRVEHLDHADLRQRDQQRLRPRARQRRRHRDPQDRRRLQEGRLADHDRQVRRLRSRTRATASATTRPARRTSPTDL